MSVYRLVERIGNTTTFKELGAEEVKWEHPYCSPYHTYNTDEFWECVVRHDTKTEWHHAGTCKMGDAKDPTAVVDPQLR